MDIKNEGRSIENYLQDVACKIGEEIIKLLKRLNLRDCYMVGNCKNAKPKSGYSFWHMKMEKDQCQEVCGRIKSNKKDIDETHATLHNILRCQNCNKADMINWLKFDKKYN